MRRFLVLASLAVGPAAFAQTPQPRVLPPGLLDLTKQADDTRGDAAVVTPSKEKLLPLDAVTVGARYAGEAWQVVAGSQVLGDFGKRQADADEMKRVLRELRPTEWASIGSPRPVVGYGLFNGKARLHSPQPKATAPIDLASVRAEQVRGAWVLKDDVTLHLNFGSQKADAEQAAAVVRKYGFNFLGRVGHPVPTYSYLYAAPAATPDKSARLGGSGGGGAGLSAQLGLASAEAEMARTGVPIAGVGFAGELVKFDPRKIEVRRDKGVYVLANGLDELARFGANDWAARDALKLVQDYRFTEFGRVGEMTFFLVNGEAPTRVPFNVKGLRFDLKSLKVRAADAGYGVYEGGGRMLFKAPTIDEAEQIAKAIQSYGFDTTCQLGLSPTSALRFLAKTGGR